MRSRSNSRRHRLTKKKGNLTGVSAGLAEYFDIDPLMVRVGFVAGSFFSFGTAAIVYLGLAAFLPDEEEDFRQEERYIRRKPQRKFDRGISILDIDEEDDTFVQALQVCWSCDTVSKPNSTFCHKCGAKLK